MRIPESPELVTAANETLPTALMVITVPVEPVLLMVPDAAIELAEPVEVIAIPLLAFN